MSEDIEIATEVFETFEQYQVNGLPGKLADLEAKVDNAQPGGDYLVPEDLGPLQAAIEDKQPKGNYLLPADLAPLQTAINSKQPAGDYVQQPAFTDLQTQVEGKQPAGNYATQTALQTGLAAKLPAFEPVATYAAMITLANPQATTFYLVAADEVNFGGEPSIYAKTASGSLYWFAAQKIN